MAIVKIDTKTLNEITSTCKNLPSEDLYKYCVISEHVNQFFVRRKINNFYGSILNASLSYQGNPARDAYINGDINKNEYECYMALISADIALLTVFQLAWRDIKVRFKDFKNPPKTELKLFFSYLTRRCNGGFIDVLENRINSTKNTKKLCSLVVEQNQRYQSYQGLVSDKKYLISPTYSLKESRFFENISPNYEKYFHDEDFANIAYIIAVSAAETDEPIKKAIKRFNNCASDLGRWLLNNHDKL